MDGLEFLLSMEDGVSKSALAGSSALKELQNAADLAKSAVEAAAKTGDVDELVSSMKSLRTIQGEIANTKSAFGIEDPAKAAADAARSATKATDELKSKQKEAAKTVTDGQIKFREGNEQMVAGLKEFAGAASVAIGVAIAFATAVAGITFEGAKLAIGAADFRGDMEDAYASALGTADGGRETFREVDKIAQGLTASFEATHERAVTLLNTGLAEAQMEKTLQALGDLEATGGKFGQEAASKVQAIIERATTSGAFEISKKQLTGTGIQLQTLYAEIGKKVGAGTNQVESMIKAGQISAEVGIDALNETIGKKFGGNAEKNITDIDVTIGHLKSNFKALFADVDSTGFLKGLSDIAGMFSQDSAMGNAFHTVVTGAFTYLFDAAEKVLPYVVQGMQYITIGVLRAYIAMGPLIRAVREFYAAHNDNGESTKEFWEFVANSMEATGIAAAMVGGAVLSAVGVIIQVKDQVMATLNAIGGAWEQLKATVSAIFANPGQIAADFVNGLILGIKNKATELITAVANLGQGAIDTVKAKLGIKSPSTVMYEVGDYTGQGMVQGIEDSSKAVHASFDTMATPPRGGAGGGGGGPFSVQITIEGGGKGAEEIAEEVAAKISAELEHYGLHVGVAA